MTRFKGLCRPVRLTGIGFAYKKRNRNEAACLAALLCEIAFNIH
jgi:hypothetical protein